MTQEPAYWAWIGELVMLSVPLFRAAGLAGARVVRPLAPRRAGAADRHGARHAVFDVRLLARVQSVAHHRDSAGPGGVRLSGDRLGLACDRRVGVAAIGVRPLASTMVSNIIVRREGSDPVTPPTRRASAGPRACRGWRGRCGSGRVTAPLSVGLLAQHLGVVVQPAEQPALARRDLQRQDLVLGAEARIDGGEQRSRSPSPVSAETSTGARSPRGDRALGLARARPRPGGRPCSRPRGSAPRPRPRRCRGRPAPPPRRAPAPRSRDGAMSRTCRMRSASTTSSSVARKAATSVVGRSEMKPTVSDRIMRRPLGQLHLAHRRVERGEQLVLGGSTSAPVRRLNSVDLPALV